MDAIEQLLLVAERYGRAEEITDATVSTRVFNDGKKLGLMRRGEAGIGVRRAAVAMLWFSENWPENVKWPRGVRRPKAEAASASAE